MDQFVVYELQSALLKDSLASAHPMTNPVKLPEEINNIFDYVTYGKCMYRTKISMTISEYQKEINT